MASFFSPIQQPQRSGTMQNTPPPPGLPYNLPSNTMNGYGGIGSGSHSSHSASNLLLSGTTANTNNAAASPNVASAQVQSAGQYQDRLDHFQRADAERTELILELIRNYQDTLRQLHEVKDDLDSEVQSRRTLQQHLRELEQSLEATKRENTRFTESNPFVFVIIDGDGAVFTDELLTRGVEGGAEAARRLVQGIRNHLQNSSANVNVQDWSIMVQLVLNMDGLSKKLLACKILSDPYDLYNFGVGFSRSQHLFSFVDVGSGKERADHKVREMFSFMARMSNCKHLYFGPCNDNGYLPFLDPYLRDPVFQAKTTLFETTPAEPGFRSFGRITFENIFRTEPLPAKPQPGFIPPAVATAAPAAIRRGTELTGAVGNNTVASATVPRAPSTASSSPPQPKNAVPAPSSWAAMSKSGAGAGKTIDIAPAKKPPRKSILLNRDYERLDEQLPPQQPQYQKKFAERIKDKNCCNNYHLKGQCANGDGCNFQHGERLSAGEQIVLRHKARSIKCNSGSYCEDFDCPYGHRCKFGGKECGHDDCRFFDTHHVDSRPAVRKYEDGTYEQV